MIDNALKVRLENLIRLVIRSKDKSNIEEALHRINQILEVAKGHENELVSAAAISLYQQNPNVAINFFLNQKAFDMRPFAEHAIADQLRKGNSEIVTQLIQKAGLDKADIAKLTLQSEAAIQRKIPVSAGGISLIAPYGVAIA